MALRVPLHAHDAADDERGGQATQVAFEDLWKHRAALRDICQRIVGDAATADDVVQETYLRALRNLDSLERRPSLMPWLATVARRRSIDELRRRGYQHPVEEMPDEGTAPEYDPGETAVVNETVSQVREALTALTDRERELLVRQVNQGLSLADLAESEDSSVASVRSVLSRARTKLRDALSDVGTRVLAPLGALGAWLKRKTTDLNVKVQQASPLVGGSYDRFGEIATASVTAAALAVGGALVPAGASTSGGNEAAVETVGVSGDEVSSVRDGMATGLAQPDADAAHGATGVAGDDSDIERAPERSGAGTADTDGDGPTLPTTDVSTHAPSESPEAPPDQGEPVTPPSPDPEQPEDAEIIDLGAAVATSDGPMFAMGSYYGECGGGSCAALFRSDDAGGSWTALDASGLSADHILVPPGFDGSSEKRLYAMGESGLQRSTNAGRSFHTVLGPGYVGPATISPAFNDGHDKIFIGSAPFWSYDASDGDAEPLGLAGITGTVANFAFAPDYSESGVLYAGSSMVTHGGTVPAVYTCSDDGACEGTTVPGMISRPEVVVYDDGPDRVVVAFTSERMAVSVGDTLDFTAVEELPLGGKVSAVSASDDGDLYVTFDSRSEERADGGIAVSADAGTIWEVLSTGTSMVHGVNAVTVAEEQVVVARSDEAGYGVSCSRDGGTGWARRCA